MTNLSALLLIALAGSAGDSDTWIRDPAPGQARDAETRQSISRSNVFEVPTSMLGTAFARLDKEPIVALDDNETRSIGRGHFRCIYPEKPYLVRAVYENGGTGVYGAERIDDALWVTHSSLGPASGVHRSALLVCLDYKPRQLFVSLSGAL